MEWRDALPTCKGSQELPGVMPEAAMRELPEIIF
jgi:hypothetical protein